MHTIYGKVCALNQLVCKPLKTVIIKIIIILTIYNNVGTASPTTTTNANNNNTNNTASNNDVLISRSKKAYAFTFAQLHEEQMLLVMNVYTGNAYELWRVHVGC